MTRHDGHDRRTLGADPADPAATGRGAEFGSPVSDGCFPDGTEPMLWNPAADRTRLRWLAARAALTSVPTLGVPAGVGIVGLALRCDSRAATGLLFLLGLAAIVLGIGHLIGRYQCFTDDHTHGPDRPCRLDRTRGEFFYRAADFADFRLPLPDLARGIIDAVDYIHASPTAEWLDRHHLHEIHQVAWDTLRSLDHTRTARRVLDDIADDVIATTPCAGATDTDLADLAHTARAALTEIDHGVLEVLTCLLQSVDLTRAWAGKLHDNAAFVGLCAAVDEVNAASIDHIVHAAESIPQTTFAYVTAARDVLAAGPFAWEEPAARVPVAESWPAQRRAVDTGPPSGLDPSGTTMPPDQYAPTSQDSPTARPHRPATPDRTVRRTRTRRQRGRPVVRDERGSATAELTLLTPLLILMLLFVVFCGRLADTRLRLDDAAHQAARAASLARSTVAAQDDAHTTAQTALASAGVVCRTVDVTIDTAGLRPGSTVTATLTCVVGLSDLTMLGIPGATTLSASFSSPVDVYRGDSDGFTKF